MRYRDTAANVFSIESNAVANLVEQLDVNFDSSITTILETSGRVIVCGMGKSGIIGRKISATLASTGTPSFFMHPGEAFHGDLGMVSPEDIFLALSNSGETEEVLRLLPFLRENGNILISMTGNKASTLAKESTYHINVSVEKEACPLELAPTSSTTATLAMGDALAVALMNERNFRPENFARFHPGGSLGRKLLSKIKDEMVKDNLPIVEKSTSFIELLHTITSGEQGMAIVTENERLLGVVTDGDVRRAMETYESSVFTLKAKELMTYRPLTIRPDDLVSLGISIMEENEVNKLVVVSSDKVKGIFRK